jgi:putative ABC transport system permease protein
VVNQAFAPRFFAGADPVGQRVEIGRSEPPAWIDVVGVVNDSRNASLEKLPDEQVFVPMRQQSRFLRSGPALSVVARTRAGTGGIPDAIRQAVWSVDKDQPLHLLQPMTQVLTQATAQRRFTVLVLGVFAALAAALAGVGLYGVMSYSVAQRTQEIGVRMALGAQRWNVLRLILGSGVRTLAVGVLIGGAAALAVSRGLQSLLFETSSFDLLTYGAAGGLLFSAGLLACWLPARRATRIDPMIALRWE